MTTAELAMQMSQSIHLNSGIYLDAGYPMPMVQDALRRVAQMLPALEQAIEKE